jgi:hypothetical protein
MDSSTRVAQSLVHLGTSALTLSFGDSIISDSSGTVAPTSDLQLIESQLVSNQLEALYNGQTNGSTTHTGQVTTATEFGLFCRGESNEVFTGYISEVVHWPSDQSANRTGIETNINDYYTIY